MGSRVRRKIYLTTGKESNKVKHLEKNNKIGINIVDPKGFPYIGISGTTKFIHKSSEEKFTTLRAKIFNKYDSSGDFRVRMADNPTQIEGVIIEIEPKFM